MSTHTIFVAYRYQLLPLDRNTTKDLYDNISTEEVIAQKNKIFAQVLSQIGTGSQKPNDLTISIGESEHDLFKIVVAPSRPLTRETPDQKKEQVENWPHIEVFVLNGPNDQFILIQNRAKAFAKTDSVANIIRRGTRGPLERLGLSLQIEPLFNKSYFWDLVSLYNNRITGVEFEFITPNMSNISKTLEIALKKLGKETNAVREQVRLRSDPASSLDLTADNLIVNGLVEYTSKGAGEIKLKVKGIRKLFHTSNSRREVHLSGIEITADAKQISEIIREVLG